MFTAHSSNGESENRDSSSFS